MREMKIKQFQYESEGWKRLLVFILEENIHLKNRLSEVLSNGFDRNSLDDLEDFQTGFIKEDELVESAENEIKEFDKLLLREIFEDGKIAKKAERKTKKLRTKIKFIQTKFSKLKQEFDNYLTENIN